MEGPLLTDWKNHAPILLCSTLSWIDQSGQRQIKTFLKSCKEELKKVDFGGSSSCSCSASTIRVHSIILDCVKGVKLVIWKIANYNSSRINKKPRKNVFFIFQNNDPTVKSSWDYCVKSGLTCNLDWLSFLFSDKLDNDTNKLTKETIEIYKGILKNDTFTLHVSLIQKSADEG